MRANALAALEADADGIDSKTIKRAEWEGFAFEIQASGLVRVRNESYLHPDEHEYEVTVENGVPVACECPADTYHAGPCMHRVAVAIREPVIEAATSDREPHPRPDGGQVADAEAESIEADDGDGRPDDCECPVAGLSCWPCYHDGFETPAER